MGLVKMECPGCGQSIQLDNSREFGFCLYCGTKVMVDRVIVQHQGTVSIDRSQELKNLYELARRAKNSNNSANAQKYYEQILVKDPFSWEATFYTIYYQSVNCTIAGIQTAAINLINCEATVLQLIKNNIANPEEQKLIVGEVAARLMQISKMFCNSAINNYEQVAFADTSGGQFFQEMRERCMAAINICYYFGDYVISYFGDFCGSYASLPCWATAVDLQREWLAVAVQMKAPKKAIEPYKSQVMGYVAKIQRLDPSYPTPKLSNFNLKFFG